MRKHIIKQINVVNKTIIAVLPKKIDKPDLFKVVPTKQHVTKLQRLKIFRIR